MPEFQQPQQSRAEQSDLTRSHADALAPSASHEPTPAAQNLPPLGNQAMQRLLRARAIQAKLDVSAPGDSYEREADAVADRVMRAPAPDEKKKTEPAKPVKKDDDKLKRAADTEQKKRAEDERRKQPEKKKEDDKIHRQADKDKKKDERPKPAEKKKDDKLSRQCAGCDEAGPEEQRRDEPPMIYAKAEAPGQAPTVSHQLESSLAAQKGAGQPLPESARDFFEPRFGHDLSGVRVHTDSFAADAAREVNARAFTRGQDIYFGAGRYQPDTEQGRRLIAHELTHTMQQSSGSVSKSRYDTEGSGVGDSTPAVSDGAVQRDVIQRTDGGGIVGGSLPGANQSGASTPEITIPLLLIPSYKLSAAAGGDQLYRDPGKRYYRKANYDFRQDRALANDPRQIRIWQDSIDVSETRTKLSGLGLAPNHAYMIMSHDRNPFYTRIGDLNTLGEALKRPFWKRDGTVHDYEVDHVVELQVAGWPEQRWAGEATNLMLATKEANRRSGEIIREQIDASITRYFPQIRETLRPEHRELPPQDRVRIIKQNYRINFQEFDSLPTTEGRVSVWKRDDVERGAHIDALSGRRPSEREVKFYDLESPTRSDGAFSTLPGNESLANIIGRPDRLVVYKGETGGSRAIFNWPAGVEEETDAGPADNQKLGIAGFECTRIAFNRSGEGPYAGTLRGVFFRHQQNPVIGPARPGDTSNFDWRLRRIPGSTRTYAGTLDINALRSYMQYALVLHGLSPVVIDNANIDARSGIVARGRILPTVPLFDRLQIDLVVEGNDVRVERTFETGDISVPRPFQINNSSLTVSLGSQAGFGVRGRVDFGIERVGQGFLEGMTGTQRTFALSGGFDFDSTTFSPARIRLRYEDGRLSGEGELGIPPGRVRGIRTANIRASYSEGRLEAHGTAEFTLPGLRQGTLDLVYSEAEGMTLGGAVEFGSMPGIRSGSLAAQLRRPAGAPEWQLSARGTAVPNIPGVDATVNVAYEDGVFNAEGSASYSRGMLSGSLQVGATNRPLDAQGQPVPNGEPTRELRAYGGGTVTLRLAPWLQGTVGLRLLPNGELEVSGSVGLPASLDIFPEKRLDKNIFSIGIDIPIVGLAVAGHRIGIFATIRGGLDASAGIGPGQLRQLGLSITYNPAHEDQTHVTGGAQLYIPAHAGLRLFVRGGLGVGIPIVSATAALEVGASLGIEGAVTAGVTVDWTPTRGLVLDAEAAISAQPKFRFDITGMVLVEADLLLTTVELYSQRWNLASFEYGSDLRFGVRFPVHYQEGQPFDVSLSDVQFDVPQIDPMELLEGLIQRIV